MAKMKQLPKQIIKVKNYGDGWINRLAVVLATTRKMDKEERAALLALLKSKYRAEWPSDNY